MSLSAGSFLEKISHFIFTSMNKQYLLKELRNELAKGTITEEEILLNLHIEKDASTKSSGITSYFTGAKMLYIIGGVIVVTGIITLISQMWDALNSPLRILITLGLGLLLTGSGSVLLKKKPEDMIGLVFQAMGGALIPGGALVTLHELSTGLDTVWPVAIAFGAITAFYLLLNAAHKNALLTFFAITNGTAFLYLLTDAVLSTPFYQNGSFYAYLTMVIGASYLLLAYAFREGWNQKLSRALYLFGTLGFLGAAFSRVFDSGFWQIFYFFILGASVLLSVYLKKRTILVLSMLFLVAHVSYITGKYFADSLGWPLALVILGFVFIGLGFATVRVNKKYIAA